MKTMQMYLHTDKPDDPLVETIDFEDSLALFDYFMQRKLVRRVGMKFHWEHKYWWEWVATVYDTPPDWDTLPIDKDRWHDPDYLEQLAVEVWERVERMETKGGE